MANGKEEIVEQEMEIVETTPDTTVIEETGISDKYLNHLDFVANNIDRFVAAKQKIWSAILKLAKDGDWVVFEAPDPNSTTGKRSSVCLSGSGADRIASSVGISFSNWKEKKETGEDEKGKWYRYWFEVDASWGGRTVKVMARSGSRDKFFGVAHGELKELSDIDESNVKMAAFHNAMKEGVKILLGLRNIPISEFEKAGIKLSYARKYEFKSNAVRKQDPTPAAQQQDAPVDLSCNGCGKMINEAEKNFSEAKYGKRLCRDCQRKEK